MRIVYHINSLCNPGGMERVTLNKAAWLARNGWDVTVLTTDQCGKPLFYPLPDGVATEDLGINYSEDKGKGIAGHTISYIRKRRMHRKRLTEVLSRLKADIMVSLYPGESSFIPSIKDGSRKILELHQNRYFHRQYANKGLLGLADRIRELMDVRMVRRFDRFVVLTNEDRGLWGNIPNIEVIPNAAVIRNDVLSDCTAHRAVAVGRLDYQKGFDRLIEAWSLLPENDWTLDIFGQGEWKESLEEMIRTKGIEGSAHINAPVSDICGEYGRSSMLIMTSHYEGLPMVMIEAMSCGLPVVSFDFRTGPRDIIRDGENGRLVKDGDMRGMSDAIAVLMSDDDLRMRMGHNAVMVHDKYSETSVMDRWISLFNSLTGRA